MGVSIKQNTDGSLGLAGPGGGTGEFIILTVPYTANSVDQTVMVATRRYIVASVVGRPDTAGTDGSAVTAAVKIAASATAISSGTAVHSGTYNLKGTAATNQTLTLSTTGSDLILDSGQAIGVDFTGTLTAAAGTITIALCPA